MTTTGSPVTTRPVEGPEAARRHWHALAIVFGVASLFCYFFSSVFGVLPWSVERLLFYSFGPTLAVSSFAAGMMLRTESPHRPLFDIGTLLTVIAGVTVNLMAVVQDSNFTIMGRKIAEAETEATKDTLTRVLGGVNNVQLSLDIAFDIWIASGCFFFALGCLLYFRQRLFGALGMGIAAMALAVNFATLPDPPAESGLFDPGPFVATWLGLFLAVAIFRCRDGSST